MVYLPTQLGDFVQANVGKYSIHWAYGFLLIPTYGAFITQPDILPRRSIHGARQRQSPVVTGGRWVFLVLSWLVVDLPLWKMMDFVSWDDEIPNWMESHKMSWFGGSGHNALSTRGPGFVFICSFLEDGKGQCYRIVDFVLYLWGNQKQARVATSKMCSTGCF